MHKLQHPDVLKSIASELRSAASNGLSREDVSELLRSFFTSYYLLGISRSHHQIWFRARVCDKAVPYSNVRQMLYPPSGSPTYNRASFPGSRVLYAGWNSRLALEEIGAVVGDSVQLVSLRVRSPIEFRCAIIGEYQAIFNSGRSVVNSEKTEADFASGIEKSAAHQFAQVFVDSVIAEIFRANIEDPNCYLTSATIAENFVMNGNQGLMYPSVRTAHSVNLAVRAIDCDSNFEVLDTVVLRVKGYHGYGLYALEPVAKTCEISSQGSFVWDSKRVMNVTLGKRRDPQVAPDFLGWRAA